MAAFPATWTLKVAGLALGLVAAQTANTGPEVWQQTRLPRWTVEVIAYGDRFGFLVPVWLTAANCDDEAM